MSSYYLKKNFIDLKEIDAHSGLLIYDTRFMVIKLSLGWPSFNAQCVAKMVNCCAGIVFEEENLFWNNNWWSLFLVQKLWLHILFVSFWSQICSDEMWCYMGFTSNNLLLTWVSVNDGWNGKYALVPWLQELYRINWLVIRDLFFLFWERSC